MQYLAILLCLLISVHSFLINTPLQSPCPHVFKYKTRYDFYQYGLLSIPSPPLNQPAVSLVASFVLRGRLPTQYGGLLELKRSRNETIVDILQQKPIEFIINFPMQAPLPRLVYVSLGNRLICGQSDSLILRRNVVQHITFQYTFNTSGLVTDDTLLQTIENEISENNIDDLTVRDNYEQFQFSSECGVLHDKFSSTPLVADGTSIERGSWPWLVAIYSVKSSGPLFRCAGTLVSDTLVLTAASCFMEDDQILMSLEILVYVGRHNLSNWLERDTEIVTVSSINKNPEFKNGFADFDIAILKLTVNVRLTEFVQPVCLWIKNDEPADAMGLFGTVVGWGGSANLGQPLGMTPESVTIPVVSNSYCGQNQETTQMSFCAGNRNSASTFDSCYGDLGSGFVTLRKNRLAIKGVVTLNTGGKNCRSSQFLLMTDVAKHTEWLRQFV